MAEAHFFSYLLILFKLLWSNEFLYWQVFFAWLQVLTQGYNINMVITQILHGLDYFFFRFTKS